jgi:osmoprotectant transport system substrate-binding protein
VKSIALALCIAAGLLPTPATACVGKTLAVGVAESPEALLLAELVAVLVNERTGTAINVLSYRDGAALYEGLKKGEVGILVERSDLALERLSKERPVDPAQSYAAAKEAYQKELGLLFLDAFGAFAAGTGKAGFGPVLTPDVAANFPAMPRVINKIGKVLDEQAFGKLVAAVKSGEKAKKVAREFLQSKRLI